MAKICPTCGAQLEDTATFCGMCGTPCTDNYQSDSQYTAQDTAVNFQRPAELTDDEKSRLHSGMTNDPADYAATIPATMEPPAFYPQTNDPGTMQGGVYYPQTNEQTLQPPVYYPQANVPGTLEQPAGGVTEEEEQRTTLISPEYYATEETQYTTLVSPEVQASAEMPRNTAQQPSYDQSGAFRTAEPAGSAPPAQDPYFSRSGVTSGPQESYEPPKKSKKGLIIDLVIAGVILIAGAVSLFIFTGDSGKSDKKSDATDATQATEKTESAKKNGASSSSAALNSLFDNTKELNIEGLAEVSYEANFDKNTDVDEEIESAQSKIDAYGTAMDALKSLFSSAQITLQAEETLDADVTESLKNEWSADYEDTDKITKINKMTYEISGVLGSSSGTGECYAVEVDGKWYIKEFTGLEHTDFFS